MTPETALLSPNEEHSCRRFRRQRVIDLPDFDWNVHVLQQAPANFPYWNSVNSDWWLDMAWFVYKTAPVIRNWEHLETLSNTSTWYSSGRQSEHEDSGKTTSNEFQASWLAAKAAARAAGWNGHFRQSPSVFWLPNGDEFIAGFALPQKEGDTFIVSPVPLPHLSRRASTPELRSAVRSWQARPFGRDG